MPKAKRLEYLKPEATLTLAEGIAELRAAEGVDDAVENVASDLVADLNLHDAIHVLFACPTSLLGEIKAHVWTIFGTTLSIRDMHRVNRHEDHRQVLADIGHAKLFRTWLKSVPTIIATLFRSLRMKRRWPAQDFHEYLNVPLVELRAQFGIRLPEITDSQEWSSESAGAALRHVESLRSRKKMLDQCKV